jgi:Tol biopolymer transport system component
MRIQQPSWAPDGERLAWVRAELQDDATVTGVVETSTADGREPTVTRTDVDPFYLSWDPTSSRVGYLGALAPKQIGFGVVELDAADHPTRAIEHGQPFYLSWGPDGRELLAHIGEDRLDRLALDGHAQPVTTKPATFNVPFWTGDGSTLIYASNEGASGESLVAEDARTGDRTSLLGFRDGLVFLPNDDGSRIAYQQVSEGAAAGPLTVLDVRSGERIALVDHLVASFFWSPDGKRLLFLDPPATAEQKWFHWGVWDGRAVFELPGFVPSVLMVQEYLPFFEQYAQSMTLWSPDSRAFAYAGLDEAGRAGIWIQDARVDRAPVLVSDGDFVSWSPS